MFSKKKDCKKNSDDHSNMILCKGSIPKKAQWLNPNVLVIGGGGSGKNRNYIAPTLLQMDTSYVVTDPGGELMRQYGKVLEYNGYHVKCLDLIHTQRSNHYNPMAYIRSRKDVIELTRLIMTNTSPGVEMWDNSFFENAESFLLTVLIGFLYESTAMTERSIYNVIRLLTNGINDDPESVTALYYMFEDCGGDQFGSYYRNFQRACSFEMEQAVIKSCIARLQMFETKEMISLTSSDDIGLDFLGDEKTALFIIVPIGNIKYNLLVAALQMQVQRCLQECAENEFGRASLSANAPYLIVDASGNVVRVFRGKGGVNNRKEANDFFTRAKNGRICFDDALGLWTVLSSEGELVLWRGSKKEVEKAFEQLKKGKILKNGEYQTREYCLPVHTRLIMDEFANLGRIPDFPNIICTNAKYGVSFSVILQSMTQIEHMYQREWLVIPESCASLLYLGNADDASKKWIAKRLGKGKGAHMQKVPVSDLTSLRGDQCIVSLRENENFLRTKYQPDRHPMWKLKESLGEYRFDPAKEKVLAGR